MPFSHFTLSARKPENPAYPKELKTLGEHLRKRRLDLGLLQREVAKKLGFDQQSIRNWEIGRHHPKTHMIPKVVDFLGHAPWEAPANFGQWLRMVRRTLGFSRKRLGRFQHIDESTLWRLETGKSEPTVQTEERLRALLLSIAAGAPKLRRRRSRTQLLPAH